MAFGATSPAGPNSNKGGNTIYWVIGAVIITLIIVKITTKKSQKVDVVSKPPVTKENDPPLA